MSGSGTTERSARPVSRRRGRAHLWDHRLSEGKRIKDGCWGVQLPPVLGYLQGFGLAAVHVDQRAVQPGAFCRDDERDQLGDVLRFAETRDGGALNHFGGGLVRIDAK